MLLSYHGFELASRANGPGLRSVLWFQGCSLGCPGCFNPGTHSKTGGQAAEPEAVANLMLEDRPGREGFSFTGGEPFQQPEAFLELLQRLAGSGLSRLAFSGYRLEEITSQPLGPSILEHLDVLIAGRYVQSRHLGTGLLGSGNQRIHLLTPRYGLKDLAAVPRGEIILHADGTITLTGIRPVPNLKA